MDPKLIAGVVVVILAIVVAVAHTCENARAQPPNFATVSGQSTSEQCKHMGPNAEQKRNWRIVSDVKRSSLSTTVRIPDGCKAA